MDRQAGLRLFCCVQEVSITIGMNNLFLLAVVWQKSVAAGFIHVFRGRVGGEISGFSLAYAGLWCFQTLLRLENTLLRCY